MIVWPCAGFAAQGFWSLQSSERTVTQTSIFDSKVVVCSVLHPIFALLSGLNIFSHNWSLSFSPRSSDDKPCTLDINLDACSSMYFVKPLCFRELSIVYSCLRLMYMLCSGSTHSQSTSKQIVKPK